MRKTNHKIHNFCTLFDKNYLLKGLAVIFSLERFIKDFNFYVLCLDDITFEILSKLNKKNLILIKLDEIENWDQRLLEVKKQRTFKEYCWTLASNLCRFILETKNVEMITYLDSDIYFFNSPEAIFDEIDNNSIAIIEHRFSKNRKFFEEKAGRFNVSWVSFKNNDFGKEALNWWSEKVIEWCYDRYENGKFGDQTYLNDWSERFKGVYIIQNVGANVAPWNIKDYKLEEKNQNLSVNDKPLIFYHFHGFHLIRADDKIEYTIGNYYIPLNVKKLIYEPYFKELLNIIGLLKTIKKDFDIKYKNLSFKDKCAKILFCNSVFENITLFFLKLKNSLKK